MASQPNQIAYGTQSPASAGDLNYWQCGDLVINNNPATSLLAGLNPWGWVCQASGYPGTWVACFPEGTQTLTTTATSGTLSQGYRLTVLNPASTGTYSLPEASGNMAGGVITFLNIASGSVTLTPLSTDTYNGGVAAITLAQYSAASIASDGSTHWYKIS